MKTRLANLIQDRSTGLVAIVVYKAVVTVIFSMAAISLFTTASEYNTLQELAKVKSQRHRAKSPIFDLVMKPQVVVFR
jgi:cell division protein FtsL